MELADIKNIIDLAVSGEISSENALDQLKALAGSDIGYAKIDYQRALRNGFPEVIYCPGKQKEHICGIIQDMLKNSTGNIMASRASKEVYDAVKEAVPEAVYFEIPKIILVKRQEFGSTKRHILVVTAGTADIPVAEEAAITAEILGNRVERLFDVGVAGIHRLLSRIDTLRSANVIIVVAGMEGALPSVVGGLVDKPVIAVPTSVGYGASFNGLSALLGMLNSCASGLGVVNIDNGFGAACLANRINKLQEEEK